MCPIMSKPSLAQAKQVCISNKEQKSPGAIKESEDY